MSQTMIESTSGGLRVDELSKGFGKRDRRVTVLDGISLDVADGEFVAVVGPSGSGKSTLLNAIAGFLPPDSGTISVDGVPVRGPGPSRCVVFQEYAIFPWLSVRRNIDFGTRLRSWRGTAGQRAEITDHYLELMGLTAFADALPKTLSGGMRQRVAIARAYAVDPGILLMDEPFAALDAQTRELLNNQQVDVHQIWAAPGSGIERIEDLRGKTMATTTGTASDLVLQVALEKAGLTRKDVEVVNLEMPAVANTFVTGGVPAASLWAPFDTQVRQNLPEATMIASAKDLDSPISGGWVAGNEFYDQHRDALEGIARAWKRANADLVADPAAGLELSCPRLAEQMPKDVCVSLYGKTEAYSNEQWAEYYQDGTAVGWVAAMQKVFGRIGALEGANTEAEDYFDTSIFLAADA